MNNTFSFSRFGRYASTEFMASRHRFFTMIWLTAAIQIGLILISVFLFQNSLAEANSDIYQFALVSVGVTVAVLISHSFKAYHNSMSAARMMMLPVSRCEKFTFSFVYNIILIPVVMYGIVVLVHTLIETFAPAATSGFKVVDIQNVSITSGTNFELFIDSLLFACIYLLGAALFRRAPFVLTTVGIVAVGTLVGWIFFMLLFPSLAAFRENSSNEVFITKVTYLSQIGQIVNYCLIPVVIALAWLRFRTLQLKK